MAGFDPWPDEDLAVLVASQRAQAQAFAREAAVLARLARRANPRNACWDAPAPYGELLMEVAGTHHVSQGTAESRIAMARHLVERLPQTHAALGAGEVLLSHARVLMHETSDCTDEVCAAVEAAVLEAAKRCMPGELRDKVKRAVLAADMESAERAHESAKADRATWTEPVADGMAVLGARVTATQAARHDADLNALLGRTTTAPGDRRTAEQRRADLVADLPGLALELLDLRNGVLPPIGIPSLLGAYLPDTPVPASGRRRRRRTTTVVVQTPVDTALGVTQHPVFLHGYGWITPKQGLALLAEAELRKACLDPRSGRLLALEDAVLPGVTPEAEPVCGTNPAVFGGDVATLVEAIEEAEAAALRARAHLREALEDEGLAPHESAALAEGLTARPGGGTASAGRLQPADVNDAVRRVLLRMVEQPTVVTDDDPAARTEPGHDPSETLREFVDLRDGGCDGPGCATPATVTDQDHDDPWPRGGTTASNLRSRSRRCHGAKHSGWSVEVDALGWSTWTSRGGRSYRRPPRHEPPPPPPVPRRYPGAGTPRRHNAPDGDDEPPAG